FTAERHVELANRILNSRGFGENRINLYWLSGAESEKFVKSVEDALEKVKNAGPNPLKLIDEETKVKKKQVITTPAE
ncbi:MAG: hydrogenase iron-sulfur subunit, partial [Promethearchaeota archaeon]